MAQDKPLDAERLRRDFEAQPWYKQLGTAADDIVRVGLRGATFGQMPKAAAALRGLTEGGTYEQRLTQEERADQEAAARAGLAGDVASVMGFGGGAKALWSGAKAIPGVVSKVARSPLARNATLGALGVAIANQMRTGGESAPAAAPAAAPAQNQKAAAAAAPQPVGRMRAWYEQMGIPKDMTLGQLAMLSESMARTSPRPVSTEEQIQSQLFNRAEMSLENFMSDPSKTEQQKQDYLARHNAFLMQITQKNGLQDYLTQINATQNESEGE